jgi:hypothetical protein
MDLLAIETGALGIAVFFAAVIAAVIVAFTVHVGLLASQVRHERREQAARLAAMRPQRHVASPGVTSSTAAPLRLEPQDQRARARKAA